MITRSEIVPQGSRDRESVQEFVAGAIEPAPRRQGLDIKRQTREETTRLVRQLFLSSTETPHVVVFSAVEHGSGCSWVCARAANDLSLHVDGSVCVVDADLRSPSLHRYFEIEPSSSRSKEGFLFAPIRQKGRELKQSNLSLLSSAFSSNGRAQGFERLRSRVSELRKDFTYILIDAPPVNAYVDAALLGGVADGVVMIIGANDTRREAAVRAKETLTAAGVRLLGAVLNKRTFPIPEKLYWKL